MRIVLMLSYNGKDSHGFQYQHNYRTVQGVIETALKKMHKTSVRIHPSSRTDRGVHALEQYCHFDTELNIEPEQWQYILNRVLPDDINIGEAKEISTDFQDRKSTRLNSSHVSISYAVFCLKKKITQC